MRNRYGTDSDVNSEQRSQDLAKSAESEPEKSKGEKAVQKKSFSRLDMIAAAATLTLSVIRVIREATDFYRKASKEKESADC